MVFLLPIAVMNPTMNNHITPTADITIVVTILVHASWSCANLRIYPSRRIRTPDTQVSRYYGQYADVRS